MARLIKVMLLVFCLIFLFVFKNCFAGDPIRKLSRGLVNTACGWVEIPAEFFREADRSADVGGFMIAPFKGIAKAIGRTVVGIYEVATFIIPLPSRYRPLIEPEFVF